MESLLIYHITIRLIGDKWPEKYNQDFASSVSSYGFSSSGLPFSFSYSSFRQRLFSEDEFVVCVCICVYVCACVHVSMCLCVGFFCNGCCQSSVKETGTTIQLYSIRHSPLIKQMIRMKLSLVAGVYQSY